MESRTPPDVLVLGGGGVLGEAWMNGLLAGLEDAAGIDLRRCGYFVGTSAGSILAARLAAGRRPRRPPVAAPDIRDANGDDAPPSPPSPPTPRGAPRVPRALLGRAGRTAGLGVALAAPFLRAGMAVAEPIGAAGRAAALRLTSTGARTHSRRFREGLTALDGGWDGRLRVVAVRRASGTRVVFGAPGAPNASVADAVIASCTVPSVYAPTVIDGVDYVDGGVWSFTNLDVIPARRGAQVLCLSTTASVHGPLSVAIRGPSRSITTLEVAALRSTGARIELVTPDRDSAHAIGVDPMALAPADAVLVCGYRQGIALARPNST